MSYAKTEGLKVYIISKLESQTGAGVRLILEPDSELEDDLRRIATELEAIRLGVPDGTERP